MFNSFSKLKFLFYVAVTSSLYPGHLLSSEQGPRYPEKDVIVTYVSENLPGAQKRKVYFAKNGNKRIDFENQHFHTIINRAEGFIYTVFPGMPPKYFKKKMPNEDNEIMNNTGIEKNILGKNCIIWEMQIPNNIQEAQSTLQHTGVNTQTQKMCLSSDNVPLQNIYPMFTDNGIQESKTTAVSLEYKEISSDVFMLPSEAILMKNFQKLINKNMR